MESLMSTEYLVKEMHCGRLYFLKMTVTVSPVSQALLEPSLPFFHQEVE